ncbi:MAG TPA: hypothetical protein VMB03_30880 [Bryobacteraceae bacterium]|nr:hypothetical protein [Bryobacteraceae bacterium]
MPSAALFLQFFQGVAILGSALTVVKLYTSHLHRRYKIFFAYFIFRVIYITGFLIITNLKGLPGGDGIQSYLYFYAYFYTEPIQLLAYILVVIELYSLVLERYRGLYTLGRWAMYGAIVISGTISILTLIPKIGASMPEPSKLLMYEVALERGVDLALVIFIILIIGFLSKYPVPLSRNVVVHTVIYSIFFLSDALVLLWRTLFGYKVGGTYNVVFAAISSACSVAWALFLTAHGEEVRAQLPQINPEAEERILHQLDALNATLLKVSRK